MQRIAKSRSTRLTDIAQEPHYDVLAAGVADMDGKVLTEVFDPASEFAARKVEYYDDGKATSIREITQKVLRSSKMRI